MEHLCDPRQGNFQETGRRHPLCPGQQGDATSNKQGVTRVYLTESVFEVIQVITGDAIQAVLKGTPHCALACASEICLQCPCACILETDGVRIVGPYCVVVVVEVRMCLEWEGV